ncbi:uncharacterized protein LOC120280181 isoform X2 [Dioscorea cayenensis subsp. rotundata]|uniref:Uncharacterized protein LOC120280181 isoform X2 n=1 Tax=Dioscorea cayennensis subsp. rotundata TaxID=55577 RepID=A0AB40CS13_DIOCR|nr:uncharacterized protein LOC120280181 isoform X2 [Dioscorea cayenensis subsp. rotundata]XP_039142872.1 uncharacterized protein LOC120280181 isoform X2 [Dioscorea cayenensis subsp. rotundata]
MDKTWMTKSRLSVEYEQGVREFLEFAFSNTMSNQILCPCRRCVNSVLLTRDEVYEHLIIHGILKLYKNWYEHGEQPPSSSNANIEQHDDLPSHVNANEVLEDGFAMSDDNMRDETTSPASSPGDLNNETGQFFKLLEDANKELYPGCARFTKLTFIVRLYHIKCLSGWSNKSLDLLLALLKEALPEGETLPESFYELKKIVKDLGLDYKKIDACPNDCMLYWKEAAHDEICKVCGASRWKQMQKDLRNEVSSSAEKEKKIPEKVLRHFPLVPRLQRLFMSSKLAPLMIWHDQDRVKDGFIRHPADSTTWKDFDAKHMLFSSDRRNVRLGLATDGFNPFGTMSVSYSTWSIILTVYNLPPWMCMKQPNFILSLLIPGPRGPGNDIDVYLQPLIDELKNLWELGVSTYDAHTNQIFQMKAALLWTISDFPGYAMLSG